MTLAFVNSPLDRADDVRRKPEILAQLQANPAARLVKVRGDQVAVVGGELDLAPDFSRSEQSFLGRDKTAAPWFACSADENSELLSLRNLMLGGTLSDESLSILAQARSLVHWHETHGFCAKCGAASRMEDGGYRRHCNTCKADHFPRTDPVVIIAVVRDSHVLLGRQASWNPGMYSALAGFMEPGETVEQAARREVFEESGIRVGNIRYLMSQPWPFPASLMIGLVGEALNDTIDISTNELQDARWFSFEEARQMQQGEHAEGFTASHSYAIAYHLVKVVVEG